MFIDYLEQYFSVNQVAGGNQLKLDDGSCPFCGESRSDLRVYLNSTTLLGQCFHCGKGFGPISFIMANEDCSKKKAKEILQGMDDGWAAEKKEEKQLVEELVMPPSVWALESPEAMVYLRNRNITDEATKHFRLIYATNSVVIGERTFYTKGRIIIPVFDINGKMCSWQGRDTTGKAKQRYLFPPGFKGREFVYNSHAIKPNPDYLIVCEGVFDVLGWWLAGFKNVVATFGKNMSEEQLDIIRTISPKRLYIAWDSDADWLKYELAAKIGHMFEEVRLVDLRGKDADEMSGVALASSLANATPYDWASKIINSLNR